MRTRERLSGRGGGLAAMRPSDGTLTSECRSPAMPSRQRLRQVDEVVGADRAPVRLEIAVPRVQAQVARAVLAGEQAQLAHAFRGVRLRRCEQLRAEALALPVRHDGEARDLADIRLVRPWAQAHGAEQPAV